VFSQAKDTVSVKEHRRVLNPSTDFDQRFSFIRSQPVNIWGQRVGVVINDKFKVGVGGYFLDDVLKSTRVFQDGSTQYIKRNLLFGTGYIEPFLFRKKYWEMSIPVELGYGQSTAKFYQTSTDLYIKTSNKNFIPAGTGLSFSVKLPALPHFQATRWIGINFLAGYRYCLFEDIFKTDYDGWFWSISGAIFLDRVADDYRGWKNKRRNNSEIKK